MSRRTTLDGPALNPNRLRCAMGRFATGVTVVTTCTPAGKLEGVTSNSFATVSLDPPLVLWSLAWRARSFAGFAGASHFAVNVLGIEARATRRHFSSPKPDTLAGIDHQAGHGGCRVLADGIARFECRREVVVDGGGHAIFIGRVLRASFTDGARLIFAAGDYHRALALSKTE